MKITPENHLEIGEVTLTVDAGPDAIVEYKVRPVTRYTITRFESGPLGGACEEIGAGAEYGSYVAAFQVAQAVATREECSAPIADTRAVDPLRKQLGGLKAAIIQIKGLDCRDVEDAMIRRIQEIRAELEA